MSTSTSTSFKKFDSNIYSRKLLLIPNPLHQPTTAAAAPAPDNNISNNNGFDARVIMILAVLLSALICSIGFHFIIRCALSCSMRLVASTSSSSPLAQSTNKNIDTGIKKKALKTFTIVKYTTEPKLPGLSTECVICLSEFADGERVRILPKCNHGFHVKCIDKWLKSHSSCPTCRHGLIETCQKIGDCQATISSSSSELVPVPVQASILNIVPLEPEGLIR